MNQKFIHFLTYFALISVFTLGLAGTVLAQIDDDILEQLEPIESVYSPDDPVDDTTLARTVAQIIQAILGFLGVIILLFISAIF